MAGSSHLDTSEDRSRRRRAKDGHGKRFTDHACHVRRCGRAGKPGLVAGGLRVRHRVLAAGRPRQRPACLLQRRPLGRLPGRRALPGRAGPQQRRRRRRLALHHRERDRRPHGLAAAGLRPAGRSPARASPSRCWTPAPRRSPAWTRPASSATARTCPSRATGCSPTRTPSGTAPTWPGIIAARDAATLTDKTIAEPEPVGAARGGPGRRPAVDEAGHHRRQHRRQPGHRRAELGHRAPDRPRRQPGPGGQPVLRHRLGAALPARPAGGRRRERLAARPGGRRLRRQRRQQSPAG